MSVIPYTSPLPTCFVTKEEGPKRRPHRRLKPFTMDLCVRCALSESSAGLGPYLALDQCAYARGRDNQASTNAHTCSFFACGCTAHEVINNREIEGV
jgi:hypothetical protein